MADEPSLGELGRLIQALRADIRDDMAQIYQRLDRVVSLDVYAVEKASMAKDIADLGAEVTAIKNQREKDTERVTQTRRWLIASVIIPALGLILPLLLSLKGGA